MPGTETKSFAFTVPRRPAREVDKIIGIMDTLRAGAPEPAHAIEAHTPRLRSLLDSPGGRELADSWYVEENENSPRAAINRAMGEAGVRGDQAAKKSALAFLLRALDGRAPPAIGFNAAAGSHFSRREGIVLDPRDVFPGRWDAMSAPEIVRHELEHSRQPDLSTPRPLSEDEISKDQGASEIGPTLGDMVHAGYAWKAVDPNGVKFKVPLSASYQPTLGWMLKQAMDHDYPTKTMDDILDSEPGVAWLKMRIAEHAPKNLIPSEAR